jgi:hypothetical protein
MEQLSNVTTISVASPKRSRANSERMILISEWITKFVMVYPRTAKGPAVTKETAPAVAEIWAEALEGVPTDALEPAFKATLKTCKWFPTPADILSHIESAQDGRADDEWQNVLEYASRHVNPDLAGATFGDSGARAPRLPFDVDHAARAAGGLAFFESCSRDDLQWAKKRFVADLTRQRQSGDIAAFLPPSGLEKLLADTAPRFALPQAPSAPAAVWTCNRENAPSNVVDPEFVRVVRKQQEKFATANEKVIAEWRKTHGL